MKIFFSLFFGVTVLFSNAQIGLTKITPEAFEGYSLFQPNSATSTFLIDNEGYLIHEWPGNHNPGRSVYLLENGLLLRTGDVGNANFSGGGRGGRIELLDWDGNITWSYNFSSFEECHHHDVQMLPNGNILAILWERISYDDAIAAGRDPLLIDEHLWSEKIIEFKPIGSGSIEVVWEWRVWDHLIQDYDASKLNFGPVDQESGKINLNFTRGPEFAFTDWLHFNAIDYNPELDQLIISTPFLNEIWIIDHSTTTEEAKGSIGGTSGKGGELIFRWGNPAAYNKGTADDRIFFGQHNPEWIQTETNWRISVFNNGNGRPEPYSSIDFIDLAIQADGSYAVDANSVYLPLTPSDRYTSEVPSDFYSRIISGAQVLPNENILICEGTSGRFFEINSEEEIVWEYINPVNDEFHCSQTETSIVSNAVFRVRKYPTNYAGLPINLEETTLKLDEVGCENLITGFVNDEEPQIFQNADAILISNLLIDYNIVLYNLQGQVMYNQRVSTETLISTSNLNGVYILVLKSKSESIQRKLVFNN
jgi:hypothetical protein